MISSCKSKSSTLRPQGKLSDASSASFQVLGTATSPLNRKPTASANNFDEDTVDAREIDKVLSELAAMSGRWNLFRKFLFDRLSVGDFTLTM